MAKIICLKFGGKYPPNAPFHQRDDPGGVRTVYTLTKVEEAQQCWLPPLFTSTHQSSRPGTTPARPHPWEVPQPSGCMPIADADFALGADFPASPRRLLRPDVCQVMHEGEGRAARWPAGFNRVRCAPTFRQLVKEWALTRVRGFPAVRPDRAAARPAAGTQVDAPLLSILSTADRCLNTTVTRPPDCWRY